jgi:hypothetical protein
MWSGTYCREMLKKNPQSCGQQFRKCAHSIIILARLISYCLHNSEWCWPLENKTLPQSLETKLKGGGSGSCYRTKTCPGRRVVCVITMGTSPVHFRAEVWVQLQQWWCLHKYNVCRFFVLCFWTMGGEPIVSSVVLKPWVASQSSLQCSWNIERRVSILSSVCGTEDGKPIYLSKRQG